MAFAPRPDVLILDEPATGLDVTTQAHVLDTIRELTRTNQVASLYITHDLAVVSELADRVMAMLRGDIVEEGPAELVLRDPQHPYTANLLASIPDLPGRRNITGHGRPRPYARAAAAGTAGAAAAGAAGAPTAPLLEVSGLGMAYGDTQVLRSIDLALEEGESILLLGESGSGKTTLARAIAGLNPGYTGDVALSGTVLEHGSRQRTLQQRQDIQYIFQSPYSPLNPRRTIGESLSVPLEMSGRLSPHRLDAKFRERARKREAEGTNWLHDEWLSGYLTVRDPLPLQTNVGFQNAMPNAGGLRGIDRAVDFVRRAAAVHLQAAAGEVPEDRDARSNRITLNQWFVYAGELRHPAPGEDTILQTQLGAALRASSTVPRRTEPGKPERRLGRCPRGALLPGRSDAGYGDRPHAGRVPARARCRWHPSWAGAARVGDGRATPRSGGSPQATR